MFQRHAARYVHRLHSAVRWRTRAYELSNFWCAARNFSKAGSYVRQRTEIPTAKT